MRMSDEARNLWETALGLNRAAAAVMPEAARLPPLIFMTDPDRTPRPWDTAARLPRGAAVIHRHFGAADAAQTARRLRAATRDAGAILLIGGDAALAAAVGADGVHLPQRDLGRAASLRADRPGWIITGAAHDAGAVRSGSDAGVDALLISPVFAPGGASRGAPLGVAGFERLARAGARPAYALGGLSADTAEPLMGSRACGIAAVDGIIAAFGG